MRLDCRITGILAGTNSCHSHEKGACEPQLENGSLVSYLFSRRENRDIWKFHDAGKNHNLYWEMLLGSAEGSFKGFYMDGDCGYRMEFKGENEKAGAVNEVHRGILDFAGMYLRLVGMDMEISGRDAYAPMLLMEGEENGEWRKGVEFLMDEVGV